MPANTNPSPAEVIAALQRGGLIEALKLVLAAKGSGSKGVRTPGGHVGDPVHPIKSAPMSSKVSDLSPGEVPRSNNDLWLLLVIAALGIGYYLFAR